MRRRAVLTAMAGLAGLVGGAARAQTRAATPAPGKGPIVLYCDLAVDPAREQEMLNNFHTIFMPTARTFKGFVDLKMLKLRTVIQGGPPPVPGFNYRFQLTYENEDLRQLWVKSDAHQRVWPTIENTLTDKGYLVLLTDSV